MALPDIQLLQLVLAAFRTWLLPWRANFSGSHCGAMTSVSRAFVQVGVACGFISTTRGRPYAPVE